MKVAQIARQQARELRKNQTEAEALLWSKLRDKQFMGLKFLRQHPIFYIYDNKRNYFIVDFYCHKNRLAIEVDGKIHLSQKEYDQLRTEFLEFKRLKILRFKNEEVLSNIEKVLDMIKNEIENNKEFNSVN